MHFAFALDRSGRESGLLRQACDALWSGAEEIHDADFTLFMQDSIALAGSHVDASMMGAVSGWIRHDRTASVTDDAMSERLHVQALLGLLATGKGWPLDDEWTGQFGAVVFDRITRRLVVCNDALGYAPVYLAERNGAILGGTSLVALGRCGFSEPDPTGIAQRISSAVSNFAGRTPLRGVTRLLPGEHREYSNGGRLVRTFDDTFCARLTDGSIRSVAADAWNRYVRETSAAIGHKSRALVALSGGWDSRLVLAAAVETPAALRCVTYGREDMYETRIARRVAVAAGVACDVFPIEGHYFPPVETFRAIVAQVENANLLQWCPILAAFPDTPKGRLPEPMLLGDYWDTLDARRFYGLSQRADRVRMTLRGLAGLRPVMERSSRVNFEDWKVARTRETLDIVGGGYADLCGDLRSTRPKREFEEELRADLEIDYARVEGNWPPFAPQFEHLFWWFHRSRYYIGGQGLTLSGKFRTAVPGASFRFARYASTLHPALLVRRRLLDAIGRLPALQPFARIPSATIPWVSLRAPAVIREAVWATRWGFDAMLTSRMMRKKDPHARQSLVPLENYLQEYRRPESLGRVSSWFSGRWIDPSRFVALANARASMQAVPRISADIAVAANVSLLLDLCNE